MRFSEPCHENAVLGETVQHTICANDRRVDRARKNQDADHNDKYVECEPHELRSDEVHRKTTQEVVHILRADRIRNDHSCQQRNNARADHSEPAYDVGRDFQILQFW